MCTCSNQLQPHDPLPRACPAREVMARYDGFTQPNGSALLADLHAALDPKPRERRPIDLDAYYASEQADPDDPYHDVYRDLGGES